MTSEAPPRRRARAPARPARAGRRLVGAAAVSLAGLLLLGPAAPTRADFEDGLAAFYRFDYATALKEWLPLARADDARAQYQLGLMYYRGEGLEQDFRKAFVWYRRAAERGDVDAQLNLGLMHARGQGTRQDFVEAFKWFEIALIHSPNQELYDRAFFNRENAASMLTEKQIEQAERRARIWKPQGG